MNDSALPSLPGDVWLSRYAKFVVAMTFLLILIGGHTTTSGAGMAFPDWPLSSGSLNPSGWWQNVMQRLEHGHRLAAEGTGLLIGVLCAWVWQSKWSIPIALAGSFLAACGAKWGGAEPKMIAHTGLWTCALIFSLVLLLVAPAAGYRRPPAIRWLAFGGFVGVVAQAILGGLRVTIETAGDPRTAIAFRVFHGCLAQLELCLLVALTTMLSPLWRRISFNDNLRAVAWLGWGTSVAVFCQLFLGAFMRHLGAGLAITTWPQAAQDGGWLPRTHNAFVDLNFTHTRLGALLATVLCLTLILRTLGYAGRDVRLIRPAAALLVFLVLQIFLGASIIWKLRPPVLTTLHVLNGAVLLATSVVLALRASRAGWGAAHASPSALGELHPLPRVSEGVAS